MFKIIFLKSWKRIDQGDRNRKDTCLCMSVQGGIELQKFQLLKNNTINPLICGASAASSTNCSSTSPTTTTPQKNTNNSKKSDSCSKVTHVFLSHLWTKANKKQIKMVKSSIAYPNWTKLRSY